MASCQQVPEGLTDCIPAIAVASHQIDRNQPHIAMADGPRIRIVHTDDWDGVFAGQVLPENVRAQVCQDAADCCGVSLMAVVNAGGRGNVLRLPYAHLDSFTVKPDRQGALSIHDTESSGQMSSTTVEDAPEADAAAPEADADPIPEPRE